MPATITVESLTTLADLEAPEIPEALETVETPELPAFNTVPKLVQPPLDFLAHLPKLPINQKPFTPPPPAVQSKVGDLLKAAQPAFKRMGQVGAYRINASPVSEWHVKPHIEGQLTGRTSLDGNRDFTAAALEFKPYAELAQNLTIKSASGVTDQFKGLGENWTNFADGLNKSLSFPTNEKLPEVQNALPTEEIKSAGISPLQTWAAVQKSAYQYRGQMPALAGWEQGVMAWEPESVLDREWLLAHQKSWDQYLAKINHHQQTLVLQNRQLADLAEQDKLAFWSDPQVLALAPELGRSFTADDEVDLNALEYYNNPGLDLPGNTLADLQTTGIVNNAGDGGLSDAEKEELKNAGLKPGMYYAKNEELGVDVLHNMRFYGLEAQTAADLNNDGENEILYTLRQRTVYVKQSPSFQPESINNLNLKLWPTEDFLAVRLPLKTFDATPFWTRMILDVTPFASDVSTFYEWQLRPTIDGPVTATHGALAQAELERETVTAPLGKVRDITGTVEVSHLSRVEIPVRTKAECLALDPNLIYYDDVLIRAGSEVATVWSYLHPLRGRSGEETQWQLEPGQELRLEYADVCLLAGTATWQQTDEEDFMARSELQIGEGLSDGSVLDIKANSTVEIDLADGQTITINGPQTYYWHATELDETPEPEQVVSFSDYMTYNSLRTWQNSKPSVSQSLTPHPSVLPWQN